MDLPVPAPLFDAVEHAHPVKSGERYLGAPHARYLREHLVAVEGRRFPGHRNGPDPGDRRRQSETDHD